jgi:hypothetical protein
MLLDVGQVPPYTSGESSKSPIGHLPASGEVLAVNVPRIQGMLRRLERCGVRVSPDVTSESIADALEGESSYLALLSLLGDEPEPGRSVWSHDVWHFDPESIGGDGDYVAIAERFRDLAEPDLPLESIEAHVDPEGCWLAFILDGEEIHWDIEWDEDWADPTVLERFAQLLASRNAGRNFTYCDLGGQDFLIGCATPEELRRLNDLPGVRFVWLLDAARQDVGTGVAGRAGGRAVSETVIHVEPKPDRFGANVKFGCGALVGFFLGFLWTCRFVRPGLLQDFVLPILVGLIVAYIVGRIALRF